MKKFLLVILCFWHCVYANNSDVAATSAPVKTVQEYVENFIATSVKELTQEEIQLLANFLFTSYCATEHDSIIRLTMANLIHQLSLARTHQLEYVSLTEPLKQSIKLTQLLNEKTEAHLAWYATWQHCTAALEKLPSTSKLAPVIDAIQTTIQEIITETVHHDKEAFTDSSKEQIKLLEELGNSFLLTAATLQGIQKEASSQAGSFDSVQVLSMASRIARHIENKNFLMIDKNLNIIMLAERLQEISAYYLSLYYKALYKHLPSVDKPYRTLMFNAQGLIKEEKRTELLPAL